MSTQANNELFTREWTTPGVDNSGASLNHLPASFLFTNAWTPEHDLFDDSENFDIADWNNHVGDNHMASLSSDEFNFANAPNWNYNPDNTTNAPLDQFMNFQNFAPPGPNTNPSSDAYHQGFCDALNLFAPVSNMIIGQEFVPAEADSSIAPIERQEIPLAQPNRPTVSNVPSTRRFACNFAGCVKTFGRQGDCDRHMKKHGTTFDYPCPEPECSKQFYRLDKMKDHARRIHHLQL